LASPDDIVREMVQQVDPARALNDLEQLTGEKPLCVENECYTIVNRDTGSEGLRWAKEYVYQELVDLGYSVELQNWDFEGYTDQNILAKQPGKLYPEEEVYIVAHLDGVGENGGEHFPAADDNASGAVDLLELARVLSGYSFSRTIVLMFSTGEEHGSLGARSYVNQLSADEINAIKYTLSIDMIGYDSNQDNVMELWSGDHQPSYELVSYISDIITKYEFDLSPIIVTDCY
jgi:Zn-dependent M28 family amino/carboxypeptidase